MSKYIKLEDATKVLENTIRVMQGFEEDMVSSLADLPTIDIVHCKDCKHRYVTGVTTQYYVCDFIDAEYRDDGYCHRGERREE